MKQQLTIPISLCQFNSEQAHIDFLKQCQILTSIPDMPICSIHHIGSTAHAQLKGRPIIDILIGLKTLHDVTNLDEKRINYHHYFRIHRHLVKKLLYARFSEFHHLTQSHQLHIVEQDSDLYHQHLQFHQLVCQHAHYREAYYQYKVQLAQMFPYDIKQYNEKKHQFIQKLLKQANEEEG